MNSPTLDVILNMLVSGFNGYKTSIGKQLTATNTYNSTASAGRYPFLAFRTGSFTLQPWKDFQQSLQWDVPARLTVQGPGEDGEVTARRVVQDIVFRTYCLTGLPIDETGKVVPFSDETVRLFDGDKLTFLCERGAPYLKSAVFNPVDDGICTVDIVFHLEALLDLDPRTLKLMKVGYLGLNPVAPNALYQDATSPDGRGISIVYAESGATGFDTQDPILPPGFVDSSGLTTPPEGKAYAAPSTIVTAVNITPYSASLSSGTPTASLSAIAFYKDSHSSYITSQGTWASSDASVATVDASGLVTRVAAGTCTITCTFSGVVSNVVAITCS